MVRPARNVRTPEMAAMEMMANAMREQATATTNLMAHITRGNPQALGNPINEGLGAARSEFAEFRKNKPPAFNGEYNPAVAEGWLQEIEEIFEVAPCSEETKVTCATFMLKGEAKNWWKGAKERMVDLETPLIWDNFKVTFLQKYFPQNIRNQKEAEFLQLTQGDLSIGQYVAKFEELSRFSRYLQHQVDEEWKALKFEQGLKPEILSHVGTFEIREYSRLVNKCLIVEENLKKVSTTTTFPFKRKFEDSRTSSNYKFQKGNYKGKK
jgi:hypothetical protein